jgi:hypothetical protein
MNYTQLRAVIQTYAQNFEPSFVENVDTFINLAESRILLRVRLPPFRKNVTAQAAAHNNLLAPPTDFLAPDSLIMEGPSGLVVLLNKDPEFLEECYPDPSFEGPLRFYSYVNQSIIQVAPTPDLDYPIRMAYFFQPPSIVQTGSSWLGDHFAHALVTGSLVEAAIYMKSEDALFTRYDQAFEKDLAMDLEYAKGRTHKDTQQEPDTRVQV